MSLESVWQWWSLCGTFVLALSSSASELKIRSESVPESHSEDSQEASASSVKDTLHTEQAQSALQRRSKVQKSRSSSNRSTRRSRRKRERTRSQSVITSQGTINLKALGAPTAKTNAEYGRGSRYGLGSRYTDDGESTHFKIYFDFLLAARPGLQKLSFQNFHSYLFVEATPTPEIQFAFDISVVRQPSPRYFELDYQLTPKFQLRLGKIWIPFDDMSPHNIYGGHINVSALAINPSQSSFRFLPDLWAQMGVGFKIDLVDSTFLDLDLYAYLVNGFQNTSSPVGAPISPEYPDFSDGGVSVTTTDNNNDKSVGGRVHALFNRKIGLGVSGYRGQWNKSGEAQFVTMLGVDTQLRLGMFGLRFGIVTMNVGIFNEQDFNRGGWYGEGSMRFGSRRQFTVLARTGFVQLDSRFTAVTDQQLIGGKILWRPGPIEFSFEHTRDLKTDIDKVNKSYTAFRSVFAF